MELEISSLQLNADFQKQMMSKVEESQTKDFDTIFKKAAEKQDDKALKDACVQLEAYMLSQVFKQMKKSMVSEDSLIPKGDYEKTFEDYKVSNKCDTMAKAGGIGLADTLYRQMKRAYGKQTI